jgi:hypothetical protein
VRGITRGGVLRRIALLLVGAAAAGITLAGCTTGGSGGTKIALLLPESKTARY